MSKMNRSRTSASISSFARMSNRLSGSPRARVAIEGGQVEACQLGLRCPDRTDDRVARRVGTVGGATMSALFAFLHHLAAFTLAGALAIEFVLVRSDITPANARRLLATDAAFGAASGTILVVGFLRVF